MTKRLIKFFKKSLKKKKPRKLRSSDKRNIPDKLKQMCNSETRSKDQAQTKISSDHKQIQSINEKEQEKSFDDLDIVGSELDESMDLNFPNASDICVNNPMI
jgi:hypothetical protein